MRTLGLVPVMLLSLAGCANTALMKTVGTLAGSSAGSAVGQAINASGPWGYVATIATTAVGGTAGNLVTSLFMPNTEKAVRSTLIDALNNPQTGKPLVWGTAKKPEMGIVATTGDAFLNASGVQCRPFRITTGMPALSAPQPAAAPTAMDKVADVTGKVEGAAGATEKLAGVGGDATKGVTNAAGTVGDAAKGLGQASAIMGGFGGKSKVTEAFGTACRDKKGEWATVKA